MAKAQQPTVQDADSPTTNTGPTVDTWSEKDQRIAVTQPADGFLYDLILRAKIDAQPDAVYEVLRDPNSHEIFRGIKDTLRRVTLEDDGKGSRKLLVGHRAVTKFLWISVTFDTELFIWEDDNARTIRFTNARSDGFMKKFDGTWNVQPFTQHTLDSIYRPDQQQGHQQHHHHQQQHKWLSPAGALTALQHRMHPSSSQQAGAATLVTLEQALAPKARPPGPVAHLVRGLCARVLQNMMTDLRREVLRRQELADSASLGGLTPQAIPKSVKQHRARPSLPVASITSSSSSSNSRRCDCSRISSSSAWDCEGGSSSGGGSGDAGCVLVDLLAAAVPLDITIRL